MRRGSRNVELSAPVSAVRPYAHSNDAAVEANDQIAGHGDAKAAGRGHAVDGSDERLRRATDFGDRAVEVLENLLEAPSP